MDSLLSVVTYLPALASLILLIFLRGRDDAANRNARVLAFVASMATFVISIAIFTEFEPADTGFQLVEEYAWPLGLTYKVGVDGVSLFLVLLTTLMMPIAVCASWSVKTRVKEYMILFLMMETFALAAFTALDLMVFFVALEAGLVSLFLLIGIWGGKGSILAGTKAFLYSLPGSLLLAATFAAAFAEAGTTDIPLLLAYPFSAEPATFAGISLPDGTQTLLFVAFLLAFALKMPIWPFHPWATTASAQAPAGVSLIHTAVFIKIGAYGLIRFNVDMLPVAADALASAMIVLGLICVIYTAVVALAAEDVKRLIGTLAVGQMGLILIGVFTFTQQGMEGALMQLLSHGLVFGALFSCAAILYERAGVRDLDAYGGLIARMPIFGFVFLIFALASFGLPGTSAFVGYLLPLIGLAGKSVLLAAVLALGLVPGAYAMLWAYRRIMLGELIKNSLKAAPDLNWREAFMVAPLLLLVLLFGFAPGLVLDVIAPSAEAFLESHQTAIDGVGTLILEGQSQTTADEN